MSVDASLPRAYFDAIYARDPDPWGFASSAYERAKYDATLAALGTRRFVRGFEIGCSIGILTRRLAERCSSLLAVDVAGAALAQARERCADLQHVEFRRAAIPAEWPDGAFDLIVLSEVLYYLSADDIARTASCARRGLAAGGCVLLVHYVLPTDYPFSGDAASERFVAGARLPVTLQRRTERYRLDLLQG